MVQTGLFGVTDADVQAPGKDASGRGPSASSDSGSDLAGARQPGIGDPAQPLDAALGEDAPQPMLPPDAAGATSNTAGTRADIAPDCVFEPGGISAEDMQAAERELLGRADDGDPLEDEEDEEEGP